MRRLIPPFVVVLALLAFASGASGAARLYAPIYGSSSPSEPERIAVFDRAADGSLAPAAGSPFAAYPGPPFTVGGLNTFAFAPDGTRAVTGFLVPGGGVQGYSVVGGVPTPTNVSPANQTENVAVTPDGRFAYTATREYPPGSGTEGIRAFALGADGAVTPIGVPYDSTTSFGGEIAITPDGRFLYALTGASIKRFAIAGDGSLTPAGSTMPGVLVGYLVVDPSGRFLFGGFSGGPAGVVSFAIGADGSLSQVGEPVTTAGSGDYFSVSPDGSYLYWPDSNEDKIAIIAVAPDGGLQEVGSMPAENAESTAVSPDNRFVYWFQGSGGNSIHVAAIGPGGSLTPLPLMAPFVAYQPVHLLFQPGPAPVASFTAKAAAPGAAASFNAAKSINAARYDWDFGDGTTLANGGPKPTHAYAKAGKYTVTLSLTDEQGCGAKQIYTGQSTTCPGGSATTTTVVVDTLPVIGKVKATPKKFLPAGIAKGKSGTKLRVKLSEAAKIQVKIERRLPGRKVGKKCKKPTSGNASKKKCNRYVTLGSRSKKNGKSGWNEIAFNGKLKGRPLDPGGYRVTAVATDSAKGRSAPKSAAFRVLPY